MNDGKTVYIVDIFVEKGARGDKIASEMADQIGKEAKAKGCMTMIGSVVPSMKNSTISLKVLLGYGMVLDSASNDFIIFRKDL